jgi:hypothetical protein
LPRVRYEIDRLLRLLLGIELSGDSLDAPPKVADLADEESPHDVLRGGLVGQLPDALSEHKAHVRLLESVWLVDLLGPATAIRNILATHIDADDSIAVIQLASGIQWATILGKPDGVAWLQQRIPFYE